MKKILIYITTLLATVSCLNLNQDNPYEKNLYEMTIHLKFPEQVDGKSKYGVSVELYNLNTGARFKTATDVHGTAKVKIMNGMYRISSSHTIEDALYNASEDRIKVAAANRELTLDFVEIVPGDLLIKELYTGGCSRQPVSNKDYQSDKYAILHNNSDDVFYLDNICIGTLSPYNSTADNPWLGEDAGGNSVFPSFLPIIQAIWKFDGTGTDFPLQPGEDAILAFCGAIDHAATYPESVNLNRPDCFVCYDIKNFPNTSYHPVPGNRVMKEKWMDLVIKTGKANAYTISVSSPTLVLFKAQGTSIEEYVSNGDHIVTEPGKGKEKMVSIPLEWIIDGVEVFNGSSSNNTKRLMPSIDAGAVFQTTTFKGLALKRKINYKKTAEKGYEVLLDTNNSSNDFEETKHASLWKEGKK